MCSALNQNIGGYSIGPGAVALELRTVRWLADLVGYDERAGGSLTSGGTMANFVGVKLARDWASKNRAQHEGIRDRWAVYVSEERHVSIDKAVDRLRRQLVKFKDQLHEVRDRGGMTGRAAEGSEGSADGRQIIRTEAYFQKPMSPDEAALQLDAIEKEFLVFVDSESDQVAIIYHRRDGNYGLIEPRR